MNLELFKDTKLACGLPEHRLRRGDIVRLADHGEEPRLH